jgi:hypothetical protein
VGNKISERRGHEDRRQGEKEREKRERMGGKKGRGIPPNVSCRDTNHSQRSFTTISMGEGRNAFKLRSEDPTIKDGFRLRRYE